MYRNLHLHLLSVLNHHIDCSDTGMASVRCCVLCAGGEAAVCWGSAAVQAGEVLQEHGAAAAGQGQAGTGTERGNVSLSS